MTTYYLPDYRVAPGKSGTCISMIYDKDIPTSAKKSKQIKTEIFLVDDSHDKVIYWIDAIFDRNAAQ